MRFPAFVALALTMSLHGVDVAWAQAKPSAPAKPAATPEPQPAQIDRNGVLILVRSTLMALHQANVTGNYTVLRDLGAPAFQSTNTASRLAEIFAPQRANNLDLSGTAIFDPQLTQLPQIVQNGMMHMSGFFPSVPLQVNFELLYAPVQGQWRLMGISVNVGQSGPAAPQVSQPDPKPAAEPPKPAAKAPPPASKPKPPPRKPPPHRDRGGQEPAPSSN